MPINTNEKQNVILIAYDGCIYLEAAHAVSLLTRTLNLIVATPDGKPAQVGEGWKLTADFAFADVPQNDVSCVLVPGGDIFAVKDDVRLDQLLVNSLEANAVIGGICNGALLLAKSGIMKNRKMTHMATEDYAPRPEFSELLEYAEPHLRGTRYVDESVVTDGRIVTAKPWAAIAFAKAVGKLSGAFDDSDAERWETY